MKPYYAEGNVEIYVADCRDVLPHLSGVHAIVTDPPYGLGFMGKAWDSFTPGDVPMRRHAEQDAVNAGASRQGGRQRACADYQRRQARDMREFQSAMTEYFALALAACVPGAHLVAFGGTRTYHRLACAIEDAGFELRDSILRMHDEEHVVVPVADCPWLLGWLYGSGFPKSLDVAKAIDKSAGIWRGRAGNITSQSVAMSGPHYARTDKGKPATASAAAWSGYGTALKPAWEPIILARTPLAGTVAANVQEHGAGAINVDGCRLATDEKWSGGGPTVPRGRGIGFASSSSSSSHALGRWPANVVLDEAAAAMLDEQSGVLSSGVMRAGTARSARSVCYGAMPDTATLQDTPGDSGGASRFFYTAKAGRAERNLCGANNTHPTVKPLDLMRWLCTLVCAPGCTVVDPFAGSGTTLIAARYVAGRVIGIEREERYAEIAAKRLSQGALPLGAAD